MWVYGYDVFDPASVYPSNRRNPSNQLLYKDTSGVLIDSLMSTSPDADIIDQVSPRIGFAYQLGNQAVLHFSYGHFFQMPPLYAMYQNYSYLIPPNDHGTTMGNVRLEPEKTILSLIHL